MSEVILVDDAIKCCEQNSRSIITEVTDELDKLIEKLEKYIKQTVGWQSGPGDLIDQMKKYTGALVINPPAMWEEVIKQPEKILIGRIEAEVGTDISREALGATVAWAVIQLNKLRRKAKLASCRECVESQALSQKSKVRRVKCQGYRYTRRAGQRRATKSKTAAVS